MLELEGKRIHFAGIGGIGMSAVAHIAGERGAIVSGCDLKANRCFEGLVTKGYDCRIGHSAEHMENVDVLVYSAAIPQDSPEVKRARELELTVLSRSHMLAHLMQDHKAISVVGSHGKTTTTWMVSHTLIENELDPTVMLGGHVSSMNGNFRRGQSEWFVSEIDESDGLPEVTSHCMILTNIDNEHTRWYGSVKKLVEAFHAFLNRTSPEGAVVVCADDETAFRVGSASAARVISYGASDGVDYQADNVSFDAEGASFDVVTRSGCQTGFHTMMPGMHNVRNALGCVAAASFIGVPMDEIKRSLAVCPRVERRMNVRRCGELMVVDDYGHHPTEIMATLETLRAACKGRILCVFQPHRYTRTSDLIESFGRAFSGVDRLCLLPIYAANESPIEGISSDSLSEVIRQESSVEVEVIAGDKLVDLILEECRDYAMVAFLGAGDVIEAADEFVARIGQCCRV